MDLKNNNEPTNVEPCETTFKENSWIQKITKGTRSQGSRFSFLLLKDNDYVLGSNSVFSPLYLLLSAYTSLNFNRYTT